jgi:aryl-alcohol dehydrogenase (NADP+)
LGINFFDTADMYSNGVSEEVLGRALKHFGRPRDRVVVATKVFSPMGDDPNQQGLSRKHIMHSIDGSLRRLGTDYVDLYQIHRFDYRTPIEETLRALGDVVSAGKALYLGASSMYAWQFARMLYKADELGLRRFVTMQNHYNLVYREEEREMIPCAAGSRPHPRSLAADSCRPSKGDAGETAGQRTTTRTDVLSDLDFAVVDRVSEIARRRGVKNMHVALAWVLAQPGITSPIIGASKMEHLEDAAAALTLKLDEDELKALAEPYQPHPVLGHH